MSLGKGPRVDSGGGARTWFAVPGVHPGHRNRRRASPCIGRHDTCLDRRRAQRDPQRRSCRLEAQHRGRHGHVEALGPPGVLDAHPRRRRRRPPGREPRCRPRSPADRTSRSRCGGRRDATTSRWRGSRRPERRPRRGVHRDVEQGPGRGADDLRVEGVDGAGVSTTASTPAASAERRIVPRLPGSARRSATTTKSAVARAVGSATGMRTTANSPTASRWRPPARRPRVRGSGPVRHRRPAPTPGATYWASIDQFGPPCSAVSTRLRRRTHRPRNRRLRRPRRRRSRWISGFVNASNAPGSIRVPPWPAPRGARRRPRR